MVVRICAFCWLASLGAAPRAFATDDDAHAPRNPAAATELPEVSVISNSPLEGLGLPLEQVPSNVQSASSADMDRQNVLDLAEYINANFSGVNARESAANPFQLDIYYHGFTASPLLGTPEGLSVYVDGVRVNESFGDTVNWDLIPQSAISTVTLISGSNPVFGLNTLGGALAIHTKSGHENPGTEFEAYGGSFGRRSAEASSGGAAGNLDWFVAGTYFDEDGWRDNSPSRVYQGFGKIGWQTEKTDVDLSYTYADTNLYGNGAAPESMLAYRRQTSYTPDFTANLYRFVNLTATQFLASDLLLSGNAYYRYVRTNAGNGNVNDSYLDDNYEDAPVDCSVPAGNRAELSYCSPAQDATSRTLQKTRGIAFQLTESRDLFGWPNQAIVGVDYTYSDDTFSQAYRYGEFAPDRALIETPTPLNGETAVSVAGVNKIYGAYLTDTVSPASFLHLTLSLRYNRSVETLQGYSLDTDIGDDDFDQRKPVTGDHSYSRLNPAVGFTVTPGNGITWYGSYNQASRAPTIIELGCSDPLTPCGLPNEFASDPDLKQVVARNVEIGVRGNRTDRSLTWSANVFRTVNSDDMQFVASTANSGYFANVGQTRRQGVDLMIGGRSNAFKWRASYSYVDATFQSPFEVSAESNSAADAGGIIQVRPGDRLPLVPTHTARLVVDYDISPQWNAGGNLFVTSGAFLHGNENNANHPGVTNDAGNFVEGSGRIPGYAVVNLQTTWRVADHVELFARLNNLFDRQYATAGFLTVNAFNPNGSFIADPAAWHHENAISPAAPRAIWTGVRVRLD